MQRQNENYTFSNKQTDIIELLILNMNWNFDIRQPRKFYRFFMTKKKCKKTDFFIQNNIKITINNLLNKEKNYE